MNKILQFNLPPQTTLSTAHTSRASVTEVMHTLSGRPVVFSRALGSQIAQLVFNADLCWLSQAQHDELIHLANTIFSPVQLTMGDKAYSVMFNHSGSEPAVALNPIMPFCDRYYGVINLIILE
jgi:hypothetical protein